jgi:hypothetical protein
MRKPSAIWERSQSGVKFLERAFIDLGWTAEQARRGFEKRFGEAGTAAALWAWWNHHAKQMDRRQAVGRAVQAAARDARKIEKKLGTDGAVPLRSMATLLGDMTMQVAFEVRGKLMAGASKTEREQAYKILKFVAMLADKTLKAAEAAGKEADRDLTSKRAQFDAAKTSLKDLPALKEIEQDDGLTTLEKIEKIRRRLFGPIADQVKTVAVAAPPEAET